jgi:hypothetical protein
VFQSGKTHYPKEHTECRLNENKGCLHNKGQVTTLMTLCMTLALNDGLVGKRDPLVKGESCEGKAIFLASSADNSVA